MLATMAVRPTIALDRSSPVPLYFQVAEQLEAAIVDGALSPGDRISNEIDLAGSLGLSRPTLRQAIKVLVDKGMLVRKRGVGTQVVGNQIHRSLKLTSLYDDLQRDGQHPRTDVLVCEVAQARDDVAAELGLEPGTAVWSLERVRRVGGEPLALLHNYLPVDVTDLRAADLEAEGLYAVLREAGVRLRVANQRIGARRAEAREARLLDERRGAPLLTMQRLAYDDTGRAVEFGNHTYRPELSSFELNLVDRQ
ncbi:myo-inositol degradation transcriptional regulator [soil metagenome]